MCWDWTDFPSGQWTLQNHGDDDDDGNEDDGNEDDEYDDDGNEDDDYDKSTQKCFIICETGQGFKTTHDILFYV